MLKDALLILGAGWMLWTGTVMVRRDVFAQLGGFDPMLKVGEDVFLWARLAVQHPRIVYVRTPIATYSQDIRDSLTRRAAADWDPGPARARAEVDRPGHGAARRRALRYCTSRRDVSFSARPKITLLSAAFGSSRAALEVGKFAGAGSLGKMAEDGDSPAVQPDRPRHAVGNPFAPAAS